MDRLLIVTDDVFTYSGREKVCSNMVKIFSSHHIVDVFSFKSGPKTFHDFSRANEIIVPIEGVSILNQLDKLIKKRKYTHVFIASMGKLSIRVVPLIIKNRHVKFYSCEHVSFTSLNFIVKILKLFFLRLYKKVILLTDYDSNIYDKFHIDNLVIENQIIHSGKIKKDRGYTAIAVGRLNRQKNFEQLIDIWAEFKKSDVNNWVLKIAGEGEQRQKLLDKIEEKKLTESVVLLGKVEDMTSLYNTSDLCLMTSIYEGLPLALLEAKAHSIPCIAFDCKTGPSQIIQNKVDGYVVDVNNNKLFVECLQKLSLNDMLYFEMSKQTIETSKKFGVEEIAKKWKTLVS